MNITVANIYKSNTGVPNFRKTNITGYKGSNTMIIVLPLSHTPAQGRLLYGGNLPF